MNSEDREEYVKYRMESAIKTYDASLVLAQNEFWNSAVNRLYYAAFYAINALLVSNGIQTKSHTATKTQFSKHFIKTGIINKKYGLLFSQLFDWRQKGDYDNIFEYDKELVDPLFEPTLELIKTIEKEIGNTL